MEVICVQHPESVDDEAGIISGQQRDPDLTGVGVAQFPDIAERVAGLISDRRTLVAASPRARTRWMANVIARSIPNLYMLRNDVSALEANMGIATGKTYDFIRPYVLLHQPVPLAETPDQLYRRVAYDLHDTVDLAQKVGVEALVFATHNGWIQMAGCVLDPDLGPQDIYTRAHVEPGEIRQFTI